MGKFFKKYLPEVLIFVFGVIITIACGVWLKSAETAVLSFVITVSTDIIVLSFQLSNKTIDENISERIRAIFMETYLDIQQDMEKMNSRWRDDAIEEIKATSAKIKEMANGMRNIAQSESIEYQANLLRSSSEEILAIHLGGSESALLRWDAKRTTKDFSTVLIDANKACRARVKRRLFIIENNNDRAYLQALYTALNVQKNMHFETRAIYRNAIADRGLQVPQDMLICDKSEVVVVGFIGDQVNATAYVSPTNINKRIEQFNSLWAGATAVTDEYLSRLEHSISPKPKPKRRR